MAKLGCNWVVLRSAEKGNIFSAKKKWATKPWKYAEETSMQIPLWMKPVCKDSRQWFQQFHILEKGKPWEIKGTRGGRAGEGDSCTGEHKGHFGNEATLYEAAAVGSCQCTFVQTHRMHSTKSDSSGKPRTLGDHDVFHVGSPTVTKVPYEACWRQGGGVHGKSLYLPLDFAVSLKLL